MMGGAFILFLNLILISYGYWFAFRIHNSNYFGKMVILGLNTNYFLYVSSMSPWLSACSRSSEFPCR